ncbi:MULTISPECIES: DUF4913 domain-containing protein [Actinomyces]|uniref:DUF4913 domain-containing protein n=1 Tax=Actinomyces marmotae TaxID=2737173 RepID=A0A6M8AY74_9ACTO|nr:MULTISPECIES: DUF4913 domain-containing protein [Actinomyces]QKD79439.1 DUF4913 domain-containing protein [Actinomyces marmotae]
MSEDTGEKKGRASAQAGRDEAPGGLEPVFPTLEAFVEHVASSLWDRVITDSHRWCDQWWNHPEAVYALTCLWHAWEQTHVSDAEARMRWLLQYSYPLMDRLCSANGPFCRCKPHCVLNGRGHNSHPFNDDEVRGLPTAAMPEGVFGARQ